MFLAVQIINIFYLYIKFNVILECIKETRHSIPNQQPGLAEGGEELAPGRATGRPDIWRGCQFQRTTCHLPQS